MKHLTSIFIMNICTGMCEKVIFYIILISNLTGGYWWWRRRSIFRTFSYISPFPALNRKQRHSCHAQCHWEVKAGRIRKGQEQGSGLQGNRGQPIPPGIILTLETQDSADSGSMGFSGEEKEGGGVKSRILHQEKCATLCPNYPQSCRGSCYLFRCFSLNVHLPVLAVCQFHT